MKMMAALLALAVCASAHASQTNEKDIRVEKTLNGIKQSADRNGLLVTRVGPSTEDVGQGPYAQARVTVFQNVNGEEKVLASKIVPLNQSNAQYSDSVDYIGQCTKDEGKEPKCTTTSAPIGLMAHVQYKGTPKNGVPLYRVALGWRVLDRLSKFSPEEDATYSIELPQVGSRELLQDVAYKQPVEFKGYSDGKTDTIMRLEML